MVVGVRGGEEAARGVVGRWSWDVAASNAEARGEGLEEVGFFTARETTWCVSARKSEQWLRLRKINYQHRHEYVSLLFIKRYIIIMSK